MCLVVCIMNPIWESYYTSNNSMILWLYSSFHGSSSAVTATSAMTSFIAFWYVKPHHFCCILIENQDEFDSFPKCNTHITIHIR